MEPLTTAELRALHALARYETATAAARATGLSPQTLRNQAAMAYKKLGVNGRVEAFRKVGWLRPPRFIPAAEAPDPFKTDEFDPPTANHPEEPGRDTDQGRASLISFHRGETHTAKQADYARDAARRGLR